MAKMAIAVLGAYFGSHHAIAPVDELDHMLAALPPDQREVLELRDFEGREYRPIADQLGVPVGPVRSRLNRARARVRASAEWLDMSTL